MQVCIIKKIFSNRIGDSWNKTDKMLYLYSMMEFILLFPLLLYIFEIFQKENNPGLPGRFQRMSLD